MFCENCGTKLPDEAKFCAKCGAKQHLSAEQTPSNNNINNNVNTKLVPAKCTNCGEQLTVDPTQQAAVCPFCNSAYVVEEAIENYNIQLTEADKYGQYLSVVQPQNIQHETADNNGKEQASISKYMRKPGGCGRIVLFLFIAIGLLTFCFSSPKEKQDNKPQTAQTQQVQTGEQNTDKKATQRKNFGKADDFWKAIEADMATKKESGYSIRVGREGWLTKKNSKREIFHKEGKDGHEIPILADISSNNIDKVTIYLLRGKLTDDYSYYGYMCACLVSIRATSPDLSTKDAQEIMKKIHLIAGNYKEEGKWSHIHNDVEYSFENEVPSGGGFKFTAKIANPIMAKHVNADNSYSSVVDSAELMTSVEQKSLLTLIQEIERKHGIRCAVMTVKSTQGMTMRDFANNTQDKYYSKAEVGSILLVLNMEERKWYITTDSRMRKIITDDMVVGELKNAFISDLKKGNYSNAFSAYCKKVDQLMSNYDKK